MVWRRNWIGDDWDIWGARVRGDNDAVVNPPGEFPIDTMGVDQDYPAVTLVSYENQYLVVWQQGASAPPTTQWDIYGRYLDQLGNPQPNTWAIADSTDSEQYPVITVNWSYDNKHFVVWHQSIAGIGNEIWGSVYVPGISLFPHQIAPDAAGSPPAVAMGLASYLTVYSKTMPSTQYIYGRLFWPEVVYLPTILH